MRSFHDLMTAFARYIFNSRCNSSRIVDPLYSKLKDTNFVNAHRSFSNSKSESNDLFSEWRNYREVSFRLLSGGVKSKYSYDVDKLIRYPKAYDKRLKDDVRLSRCLGLNPLFTHYVNPLSMLSFATKYLLSFRFLFIYMARTTFQAVRPLLAFCLFGEIMKLVLANISGALPAYLFSFVLAFEVLYFFLQCYISYTFLMMFFTVMF